MQRAFPEQTLSVHLSDKRHLSPLPLPLNNPQQTQDVAHYLSSLLLPLAQMARNNDLSVLAYLLDMARLEAENVIEQGE